MSAQLFRICIQISLNCGGLCYMYLIKILSHTANMNDYKYTCTADNNTHRTKYISCGIYISVSLKLMWIHLHSHTMATYRNFAVWLRCNTIHYDDVIKRKLFSALLAICAGNSPVNGEFPAQRPVTRSFGVFFDLRLHKRLSKQSWGWFETPSRPSWRHCNGITQHRMQHRCD